MQQSVEVITPINKPSSTCTLTPTQKYIADDKNNELEDRVNELSSLQILGSNLREGFLERRNSAFSIYDPPQVAEIANQLHQPSSCYDMSGDSEELKPRKGRKEKRDKREQSRLETKNLNRYFRSKINEMLRDIKISPSSEAEYQKADQILQRLNESNKIMFSEIREIIKDEWLQHKLLKCSGSLMRYIHGGKMGMQSKLIMLKYFNKILKAIRNPQNFTCWK